MKKFVAEIYAGNPKPGKLVMDAHKATDVIDFIEDFDAGPIIILDNPDGSIDVVRRAGVSTYNIKEVR